MIGVYLVDTAVLVKKPAVDKWGNEIASAVEIVLSPGSENGGVRVNYETRMVRDMAGNEVVSTANVDMRTREVSHEDRLRFDDIEHGIIRIARPKDFSYTYLKVYVA